MTPPLNKREAELRLLNNDFAAWLQSHSTDLGRRAMGTGRFAGAIDLDRLKAAILALQPPDNHDPQIGGASAQPPHPVVDEELDEIFLPLGIFLNPGETDPEQKSKFERADRLIKTAKARLVAYIAQKENAVLQRLYHTIYEDIYETGDEKVWRVLQLIEAALRPTVPKEKE